ncbi:hypothetical protein [Francisella sp. 19X1-34]|uniref:hypothetical protein n=1 Tax=Francisella sp. 19X1-34 TaxID=3087177 RepID=UPI002E344C80|nr:hypothetical protein [Francisella sp. 19X1-34]MED7788617.1 hypothetical protein [Francisella sp. 19X1-34]
MKKIVGLALLAVVVAISGCIPFAGGSVAAQDNIFGSGGNIHSLEMEQGTTINQLYNAIMKAIKKHPKEFVIKGDSHGDEKSTVWTYSNKYNQPVTFYALKSGGYVYLGVHLDIDKSNKGKEMQRIYYLQDLVLDNLK